MSFVASPVRTLEINEYEISNLRTVVVQYKTGDELSKWEKAFFVSNSCL